MDPPCVARALEIMEDDWAVWYESREAMERREDVPRGSSGEAETGGDVSEAESDEDDRD